ncbi:MAG: DsbA family protein, partial [Asticcacaulis sp.]
MRLLRVLFALFAAGLLTAGPVVARPKAKPHTSANTASAVQASSTQTPFGAHVEASAPGLLPDMAMGNEKAPVTVVEYASAACPHCADWNKENWAAFKAKYIDTGKVHYIFREVLTNPQEYAFAGFMIGRCAVARSKTPADATPFFTVVQTFFNGQDAFYQTGQMNTVMDDVEKKTGLDLPALQACVSDSGQADAFMKTMRTHMEADNVSSTPTFLVNGKIVRDH